MRLSTPPAFLNGRGFCYARAMKANTRLATLLIAALTTLVVGLPAPVAQAAYKDGLVLVRQGKWGKAIKEFRELADTGHAQSQFSMGLIYHLGRGLTKDLAKAYSLYKASALQEHPPAINNLGMMYLNGDYVEKNQAVAFIMFERASAEHAQAKDNLGRCFENGWGAEQDIEQAMNFYELAGDDGYKLGYYHLAQLHEEGRGGAPVDIKQAITWYQTAGDNSFAKGYHRIGEIYEQGIGVPKDLDQARNWYEEAASKGYDPSIVKLKNLK